MIKHFSFYIFGTWLKRLLQCVPKMIKFNSFSLFIFPSRKFLKIFFHPLSNKYFKLQMKWWVYHQLTHHSRTLFFFEWNLIKFSISSIQNFFFWWTDWFFFFYLLSSSTYFFFTNIIFFFFCLHFFSFQIIYNSSWRFCDQIQNRWYDLQNQSQI